LSKSRAEGLFQGLRCPVLYSTRLVELLFHQQRLAYKRQTGRLDSSTLDSEGQYNSPVFFMWAVRSHALRSAIPTHSTQPKLVCNSYGRVSFSSIEYMPTFLSLPHPNNRRSNVLAQRGRAV